MSITGSGAIKRAEQKIFMDVSANSTPEWELLGDKVEDMGLELNPNVETVTDVTGVTSVTLDRYEEQTSVDPMKAKRESKAFGVLYDIVKNKKTLTDVEKNFLVVNAFDTDGSGNYVAWMQKAVVAVQSFGGDASGLSIPFNIHWIGERTHGTFNPSTKVFTAGTGVTYLVTFNVGDGTAQLAGAQITINGEVLTTDATGIASILLPAATYAYTISATGYDTDTGSVTVSNAAKYEAVELTEAT